MIQERSLQARSGEVFEPDEGAFSRAGAATAGARPPTEDHVSLVQDPEPGADDPPPVRLRPVRHTDRDTIGVFATRRIQGGSVALLFPGSLAARPDRYSIQIDATTHLHGSGTPADELRHACEPNARILVEGAPPARVVALRDIEPGEEITIDYCATEDVISEPFVCSCGAPTCYGEVRGYRYLDPQERERLGDRASAWLATRRGRPAAPRRPAPERIGE